jgi:hypothetical protein
MRAELSDRVLGRIDRLSLAWRRPLGVFDEPDECRFKVSFTCCDARRLDTVGFRAEVLGSPAAISQRAVAIFVFSRKTNLGSYIAPRSPFPEAIVDLPISTSDGSLSGRRTSLPRTAKGKEVVVERR